MANEINNKIIEEFDKKFVTDKREDGEDYTQYIRDNDIRVFLSQALLQVREDTLREVESGLLKEYKGQESQIQDAVNFIKSLTTK
jgi:hypothetical protein